MRGNDQLRKHLKPNFWDKIRYLKMKRSMKRCGKGVFFEKNSKILRFPQNVSVDNYAVLKEGSRICACNHQAVISIGQRTTIGHHTFIFASESVIIGSDCLIAPFVYLVDSDHGIDKSQLINQQPNITAPIIINDDVWIGTGAKILKGVNIGKGAVIAAGSLVKDSVAPYNIVGGIPAKKISERKCE